MSIVLQGTNEYFTITAVSMLAQQLAFRSKAVRDAVGLPPDWPNIGATPAQTGTHPLAKYLDGNFSGSKGKKVKDTYITFRGLQQPDAPPPPTSLPPSQFKAAAVTVLNPKQAPSVTKVTAMPKPKKSNK